MPAEAACIIIPKNDKVTVKKVNAAILENNKEAAKAALIVAESELMRAAQKGVLPKNTASRTVSRLSAKIKAL